jgi:hypothetical protein
MRVCTRCATSSAIQNGFDELFVTAAELIEDLSVASRDNQLADALVRYVSPHVLIIDEVGYLTYSHDAANVLYHVATQRRQAHRWSSRRTNILTAGASPPRRRRRCCHRRPRARARSPVATRRTLDAHEAPRS